MTRLGLFAAALFLFVTLADPRTSAQAGQGPLTPEGCDSAYQKAVAKFDAVHHL
jgi:hypothetical protein